MLYTLAFWEDDCQTIRAWHFPPLIKSHVATAGRKSLCEVVGESKLLAPPVQLQYVTMVSSSKMD